MVVGEDAAQVGAGIPNTPQELMTLQENKPERPEKPERKQSAKVKQVLDLIEKLDTNAGEDQQLALFLVRRLEGFHDDIVTEMKDDAEAQHSQIISWSGSRPLQWCKSPGLSPGVAGAEMITTPSSSA